MGKIAGILLAAGPSRRFGTPKALVELDGERLVDRGVRTLKAAGCAPILVVTGAVPVEVMGALVVPNADWREGMGSSLRAGLAALPPGCPAAVVALVDQPGIGAEAVRRLAAAFERGAPAAAASFEGRPSEPLLVSRELFARLAEFAEAEPDTGPRGFLRAAGSGDHHPVELVPCDDVASPDDLDDTADLDAFRSRPGG